MSWLFPGLLAGGLVVGLPVLLHFLRSKPKVIIRFPSLRFLGPTAIRDTRRHQLRRWLTLLLRCLIIALLAAAFARPFFEKSDAAHRQVMIVALDNSMSMQADQRWEDQKRWALRQLNELHSGDSAGLLLMHPAPTWLTMVSNDLARTRAMLETAQPGYEKTRYAAALRLAGSTLAAHPAHSKTLVWMADEQRLGWQGAKLQQSLPAGVKLRLSEVPSQPARQAAITALRRVGDTVEVHVRLFQPQWEKRHITVFVGKEAIAKQTVTLAIGENNFVLPIKIPAGTPGLRVELDSDDLPADDVAWLAATNDSISKSVLLDTSEKKEDADFVAFALSSTRLLAAGALKSTHFPTAEWPGGTVAILRGSEAFQNENAPHLDRFVSQGGAIWLFYDGSSEQKHWLEARGVQSAERPVPAEDAPWHLRDWDVEHPALAAFAGSSLLPLMDVEFYRGFDLSGDRLAPLARWENGEIALAELKNEGVHIFIAGFQPNRVSTNWATLPTFVPFVHGATRWLLAQNQTRTDWHVGDTIPLSADGIWRVLESKQMAPERKVGGSIRPTAPGLYEFIAGQSRQIYAVNPPPEESDLAPWPRLEELKSLESTESASKNEDTRDTTPPLSAEITENQQRLWWWLLAFCVVALLGELALANRTAP